MVSTPSVRSPITSLEPGRLCLSWPFFDEPGDTPKPTALLSLGLRGAFGLTEIEGAASHEAPSNVFRTGALNTLQWSNPVPTNASFVRKTDSTWKVSLVVNPTRTTASASVSTNSQHAGDRGTLDFDTQPTALVLMSIHASPEQGTDLGRLLMLAFARQAKRQDKQQMKISAPVAPTAFGFYATLGFVVDTSTPRLPLTRSRIPCPSLLESTP